MNSCHYVNSYYQMSSLLYVNSYITWIHTFMWIHKIRWIHFIMIIHTSYEFIHYVNTSLCEFIQSDELHYVNSHNQWILVIMWIHTLYEVMHYVHYLKYYIIWIHTLCDIHYVNSFIIQIHTLCDIHYVNSNIIWIHIARAYLYAQLSVLQKIVSRLYVSQQVGDMHDGNDCNRLGSYIDWHCHWIDRDQLGLCINGCQWWFQWWVWWWVWRWVPLGCAGLSTSAKHLTAQTRGFHGYHPRGFKGLVVKQTHHFTGSLTAISQEGVKAL